MRLFTTNKKSDQAETRSLEEIIRSYENSLPDVNGGMTIVDKEIKQSQKQSQKQTNDSALGGEIYLSAVFCALEMISSALSVLPFNVKTYDKVKKEDGSWLIQALKNGMMSINRLIKSMVTDMLLYGNGYAYIHRDKRGRVVELEYLTSTDVTVEYRKELHLLQYRCHYINEGKPIKKEDMIHLVKNTRDGFTGIGLRNFAYKAVQISNRTEQSVADYYTSGLNMSGLIHAKTPLNKGQAQQALRSVEGSVDVGKGKFIKFIPFDLEFQKLTESASDAALLETRKYNISEIARFFCISPAMLQDLSNSKYTSVEESNLSFLTETLLPYITLIEEEFNRKLIPAKSTLFIDLDEKQFLRTDAKSTANYYSTLVNAGLITRNEAREALGYSPVEGGDDLIIAYTNIEQNTIGNKSDEEPKKEE